MERFSNAVTYLGSHRPERPVFGMRPEAAGRAARWFLQNFPGDVAYAYKANSHPLVIGALYGAGIRHFDVASLPELEDAATIPKAILHFMHPVKSRNAIRRAYALGVRSFSLDSEEELEKIIEETNGARDLALAVRLAVPAKNSRMPLERKFGIPVAKAAALVLRTRQAAAELGVTFHVGSQTVTPEAYTLALGEIGKLIKKASVVIDKVDVGGGFPSRYSEDEPAPLARFIDAIRTAFERLPVKETCKLMCEPGRALVSEAESLIVRVDARRGSELFINDGGYGALFDAAHLGFTFPVRLLTGGPRDAADLKPFELWGPTCDSVDRMKGPFMLPDTVREGDYLELGNLGAYGRAIAGRFNGYGQYDEVLLGDEPMYSMYRGSNATAVPDPEGVR
jgi:ornithine decarboxylase